jgi:hypothetical protein
LASPTLPEHIRTLEGKGGMAQTPWVNLRLLAQGGFLIAEPLRERRKLDLDPAWLANPEVPSWCALVHLGVLGHNEV